MILTRMKILFSGLIFFSVLAAMLLLWGDVFSAADKCGGLYSQYNQKKTRLDDLNKKFNPGGECYNLEQNLSLVESGLTKKQGDCNGEASRCGGNKCANEKNKCKAESCNGVDAKFKGECLTLCNKCPSLARAIALSKQGIDNFKQRRPQCNAFQQERTRLTTEVPQAKKNFDDCRNKK